MNWWILLSILLACLNLWQLWRSITADQRVRYQEEIETENRVLRRTVQTLKARGRMNHE
jgi:hypothetical protein